MLDYADMEPGQRDRFIGVIRDEVRRHERSASTRTLAQQADALKARWPLEDMLGVDLVARRAAAIVAKSGVPVQAEAMATEACG